MSLRVWLPLDGDLRNLGASDVEVINNGATVDNEGKIGKCYYFNGSAQYLQFNKTLGDIYVKDFSLCAWLKPTDDTRGVIISEYASTGASNVALELLANRAVRVYWNGSPDWNTGIILNKNEWSHIIITKQNNTLKLYVNGVYKVEKITTLSERPSTACIRIGDDYRGGTGVSYMGYMNDVRIYDHCLSAAEVREIAQGLVLHYKLDSMKIKAGTNLVTGVTKGGHTTVLTDGRVGVQTTGENADTYFTINLSESITNGTKYFLSCDASGIPNNGYWYFPLGTQNNSALPFKIYNGHNEYSFVANDISWGENRLFMDDNNRQYWNSKASFWNFELYKAPALEIEDSSGYNHNATLTNGSMTNDTARFLHSLTLDASTKAIGEAIFEAEVFIPEYTWAGWIKRNYTTASAKLIHANIANINLYTNFTPYFSWTSGKTDGSTTGNGAAGGTKIATLNEWVHMAITYKSGIGKFYINGELIKTWNYTSSGVYIAAAANNILGNSFIGNLSDVRIYTTALLDNDIKSLYNIGMRVDNSHNVHTEELIETSNNIWTIENLLKYRKSGNSAQEIFYKNGKSYIKTWPAEYHKNITIDGETISCVLYTEFQPNTQYIFDMWIDSSESTALGGFSVVYTDGTSSTALQMPANGNDEWVHKQYISDSGKSILKMLQRYGTNTPICTSLDSYIGPLDTFQIKKTAQIKATTFSEDSSTAKIFKSGYLKSSQLIER